MATDHRAAVGSHIALCRQIDIAKARAQISQVDATVQRLQVDVATLVDCAQRATGHLHIQRLCFRTDTCLGPQAEILGSNNILFGRLSQVVRINTGGAGLVEDRACQHNVAIRGQRNSASVVADKTDTDRQVSTDSLADDFLLAAGDGFTLVIPGDLTPDEVLGTGRPVLLEGNRRIGVDGTALVHHLARRQTGTTGGQVVAHVIGAGDKCRRPFAALDQLFVIPLTGLNQAPELVDITLVHLRLRVVLARQPYVAASFTHGVAGIAGAVIGCHTVGIGGCHLIAQPAIDLDVIPYPLVDSRGNRVVTLELTAVVDVVDPQRTLDT